MIENTGINWYYCKFYNYHKRNTKTEIRKLYDGNFIHEKTCN